MSSVGPHHSDTELERMTTREIIDRWRELQEQQSQAASQTSLARSPEMSLAEELGYTLTMDPIEESIAQEPPVGTMLPGDVDDEGNIVPSSGDEDWSLPVTESPETSGPASTAAMGSGQASSQAASASGVNQGTSPADKERKGGRVRKSPAWEKFAGTALGMANQGIDRMLGLPGWVGDLGGEAIGHLLGGEQSESGGLLGGDTGFAESDNTAELVAAINELTDEVRKLSEKLDRTQGETPGIQPDGTFVPKGFGGESQGSAPVHPNNRPTIDNNEESQRMMRQAMETVVRLANS